MIKNLLKFSISLIVAIVSSAMACAQSTVYGITNGALDPKVVSFDFNALNEAGEAVAFTDVTDITGMVDDPIAIATVGNACYAYFYDENYNTCFGTLNFETGNATVVKKLSRTALYPKTMAYDAVSQTLYGVVSDYDDATGKSFDKLCAIDTATGDLTDLAAFDSYVSQETLCSDGNGGLYLIQSKTNSSWKYYPLICSIDVANGTYETTEVAKFETTYLSGTTYNCSLAKDGKIYYANSTNMYVFSPVDSTFTLAGTLSKGLYGMSETLANVDGEPAAVATNSRLLVSKKWYGDIMGTAPEAVDMTKTLYFYDTNLKLSRVVEYGRTYDTNEYELSAYNKYNYDENGNLLNTVRYQNGVYDFGDMALQERSSETYEYDDNNKLVKKVTDAYTYEYVYDGNNIVTETVKSPTGDVIQVLEYKEFIDENKPFIVESSSPNHPDWTGYFYVAARNYDDAGNLINEKRYPDYEHADTPIQEENWEYTDGVLTLYTKNCFSSETGETYSQLKTVYEMVDGNPDLIKETTYTANGDSNWAMSGRPCVSEYRDFEGKDMESAIEFAVEPVEGQKNTNKLIFSIPAMAYLGSCRIDIYRNGQLIISKDIYDILEAMGDEFDGTALACYDEEVCNGEYEYFVQPMSGPSMEPFEGEDETATVDEYTGYCISYPVESVLALDLPKVTDLYVSGAKKNEYDEDVLTISWTNPENMEEYGFISNDLYFEDMQLPESSTTEMGTTSLDGSFYFNNMNVFVLTRYKFGKAISDTLAVDVLKDGIAKVTDNGSSISFDGKVVTVDGKANFSVFSVAGKMEAHTAASGSIDLTAMKPGAYIVCVEQNGKKNAFKVVVK